MEKISTKTYYDKYIKNSSNGICKVCGKNTTFQNLVKGYNKYCTIKCKNKDPNQQKKCRDGVKNKYGVDNVFQLKSTKEKSRTTMLKKYGVCQDRKSTRLNSSHYS